MTKRHKILLPIGAGTRTPCIPAPDFLYALGPSPTYVSAEGDLVTAYAIKSVELIVEARDPLSTNKVRVQLFQSDFSFSVYLGQLKGALPKAGDIMVSVRGSQDLLFISPQEFRRKFTIVP